MRDERAEKRYQDLPGEAGMGMDAGEVTTFPDLVYKEFLCALIVIIFFIFLAVFFQAPLEGMADKALTPNPSKAPWYFVGLQELLVYFDPWIAGVMIPLLIVVGLMLIPYLDTNPEGNKEYTFRKRKFAIITFTAGLSLWFIMMFIGYFLRGLDWQLYWPWESHEAAGKSVKEYHSFPLYWGVIALALYFGLGVYLPARFRGGLLQKLGRVRYVILMLLILLMAGVVLKMVLRLAFNVKYVLATPWFNI